MPTTTTFANFELYASIIHDGTLDYGHYYAFVRNQQHPLSLDRWYRCEDDHIERVTEADVLEVSSGNSSSSMIQVSNQQELLTVHPNKMDKKIGSAYVLFYKRKP